MNNDLQPPKNISQPILLSNSPTSDPKSRLGKEKSLLIQNLHKFDKQIFENFKNISRIALLSEKWLKDYQNYLDNPIQYRLSFPPTRFTQVNSDLFHPEIQSSQYIMRNNDPLGLNIILPESLKEEELRIIDPELLDFLINKYGGIRIQRLVITLNGRKEIEYLPLRLRICIIENTRNKPWTLENLDFHFLQVFTHTKVDEIQEDLFLFFKEQKQFNSILISKNQTRLWILNHPLFDFSERIEGKCLEKSGEKTVGQLLLLKDNILILEIKNLEGNWLISHVNENLNENKLKRTLSVFKQTGLSQNENNIIIPSISYNDSRPIRSLRRSNFYGQNLEEEALKFNQNKEFLINPLKGLVGMQNLTNSCYMNAALQCLCHTDELKQYFLKGDYFTNINKENKLGAQGDSAYCMAILLRKIWIEKASCFSPLFMKTLFFKHHSLAMYSRNEQHDSQEFLQAFLDLLHEDLNKFNNSNGNSINSKEKRNSEQNKNEIEIAKQTFKNYLSKNNSFIVELFFGLLKSEVKCPECFKSSSKFDMFLNLSVPIPEENNKNNFKIMLFKEKIEENVRPSWLEIKKTPIINMTIKELKEYVKLKAFKEKIFNFYETSEFCFKLMNENLIIKEILENKRYEFSLIENNEKEKYSEFSLLSIKIQKNNFPIPFKIQKKLMCKSFQQTIDNFLEKYIRLSLKESGNQIEFIQISEFRKLKFKLYNFEKNITICEKCKQIECGCEFDFSFSFGNLESKYIYSNMILYLEVSLNKGFFKLVEKKYLIWLNSDYNQIFLESTKEKIRNDLSIYDCLSHFKQAEKLCSENEWFCGNCKKNQRATTQMEIYSSPKILIVHLKRFKTEKNMKIKISHKVNFPINNLDLSSFVINQNTPMELVKENKKGKNSKVLYNLYAVIYHHGRNLSCGHYTACCKNFDNGKWYKYDDKLVMEEHEMNICNNDAYVLFYKRNE